MPAGHGARVEGKETLIAVTKQAHAMLCKVTEVNYLSGPGRGVITSIGGSGLGLGHSGKKR